MDTGVEIANRIPNLDASQIHSSISFSVSALRLCKLIDLPVTFFGQPLLYVVSLDSWDTDSRVLLYPSLTSSLSRLVAYEIVIVMHFSSLWVLPCRTWTSIFCSFFCANAPSSLKPKVLRPMWELDETFSVQAAQVLASLWNCIVDGRSYLLHYHYPSPSAPSHWWLRQYISRTSSLTPRNSRATNSPRDFCGIHFWKDFRCQVAPWCPEMGS